MFQLSPIKSANPFNTYSFHLQPYTAIFHISYSYRDTKDTGLDKSLCPIFFLLVHPQFYCFFGMYHISIYVFCDFWCIYLNIERWCISFNLGELAGGTSVSVFGSVDTAF